jgi:hypothetical protein
MRRLAAVPALVWEFIVGDDWRIALAVVLALALTAVIATTTLAAWWILPLAVGVVLAVSVLSASTTRRRRDIA